MQRVQERHNNSATWSDAGTINIELAPKAYTITRMYVIVRANVTTTTATNYNDYWDRMISRLVLRGNNKTYFDFSNLRAAYHFTRFNGYGLKRPTVVSDSASTVVQHFGYCFHFGVHPRNQFGEDNPFDFSAGIPPTTSGNLTLSGTWGAASALGSNVTINSGQLDMYVCGLRDAQPVMLPVWSMRSPTPTATSTAFATEDSVPAGDFLRSILVMTTNGAGSPRDDSVLNSIRLYNDKAATTLIEYGGQSGAVADAKAAEIISQFEAGVNGWPPTDNISTAMTALSGTPAVPEITATSDAGLIYLPVYRYVGHPEYGVDLQKADTGALRLRYGVSDATGVTLDIVYEKYQPNPLHPGGRALLRQ